MSVIYLDNNATTAPDPAVVDAMLPYLREFYANASSVHRFGQRARQAIDEARGHVAGLIGCAEAELIFTATGTEAVNTAIRGLLAARTPRRRIITSTVEHSATHELCQQLAREGAEIIEIGVNEAGELDMDALLAAFADPEAAGAHGLTNPAEAVALATFMWANNETGVIFPIEQIAAICREHRVPLHCDATQAVGKIAVNAHMAGVDAMSFAGHKFHGAKGAAGLYLRRGVRVRPLLIGGPQERGRRGGTENVAAIVGMGKAAELAATGLAGMSRVASMRDRLEAGIVSAITETRVNGSVKSRLPNTTNIGFCRLEAEAILLLLSEQEICASAGAACSSGSLEASHVIKAMGIDPRYAHGAVRFSLSRFTTDGEIDRTLKALPGIISRLRAVLPVAAG